MDNYLRFEILEHFAYNEKLSKAMVEKAFGQHKHTTKTNRSVKHHHPEISEAFEFLKNEGLIIELNTDPGQGKVHGRGRPQRYYKITEYGLKRLIADHHISNIKFWKVLHGYYLNNDIAATPDKLDELLLLFVDHYVRYRDHGFTLYSDDFLNAYNNWFKEKIQTSSKTSTLQKVLEVLAINPKITFNDLVEKVAESESNVKKVLSLYSYSTRSVRDTDIIIKDHSKENTDFIAKNIITVNQENDSSLTYELSLFGVMLILLIILYNDKKRLKYGLYIKKYTFKKYCDKIAYNYNHKLPLVFGKWDHLRQILQESATYNFNVILSDNDLVDNKSNSRSVIVRGNEEIFQGIRKIVQYNNSLMQDLVSAGLEVLRDYFLVRFDLSALERLKDDATFKKINPICAMLEEIIILLNPLWYRHPHLSLITLTTLDPNRILSQMEESLADEISALYYMNLLRPNVEVRMRHDSMLTEGSNDARCNLDVDVSLLIKEIREDPSFRLWIKKWKEDISSVYQQMFETIKIWSSSTMI